jgi:hypothetical protein
MQDFKPAARCLMSKGNRRFSARRLNARQSSAKVNAFGFKCVKEAFHWGVVPAFSRPAQRRHDVSCGQGAAIGLRCILYPRSEWRIGPVGGL